MNDSLEGNRVLDNDRNLFYFFFFGAVIGILRLDVVYKLMDDCANICTNMIVQIIAQSYNYESLMHFPYT